MSEQLVTSFFLKLVLKLSEKFQDNNANDSQQRRKRKTIWFSPPFSKSIKTNIAAIFLQLVSKHFPKNHKMLEVLTEVQLQ